MAVISAYDGGTGERLYMDKVWHSNSASAALSEMQRGFSEGSGWEFVLSFAGGYTVGVAVSVTGYKDAAWQGDSGTGTIKIYMSRTVQAISSGGAIAPTPTPSICPYDTTLLAGDTRCVAPTIAAPVTSPSSVKPPASGEPETFYETYRGYTINTQGSYLHVLRPGGTGIGLFNSVIAARQGIDADIDSQTPKAPTTTSCPSGQYLDISSKIPQCLPYPATPQQAGTPAYAPPVVPGTSPASCGTGTYYDYGTGNCLAYTAPAQPSPPATPPAIAPHGERYCVDSETIAVWNSEKQDYDTAKCQNPPCKDGYCAQPQPEKPKDLTILYLLGAAAIGAAALLFGGKK